MPEFLAETCAPRGAPGIVVPDDETCFCLWPARPIPGQAWPQMSRS